MTNEAGAKPPVWFWIVAAASTLWSLAGCLAYYTQVTMGAAEFAHLSPAQREIWGMTPSWVTAAYAIAVWIGLLGSLSLLARRRFALPLFVISLIGVIVQFGWTFTATPILRTVGPAKAIPFPAFIFIVAVLLIWFSSMASKRGWLR